jgi:hypothetical protein
MAMGRSGGRSAANKQSGDRRSTKRERDLIDPPGRDEWEKIKTEGDPWVLTLRGRRLVDFLVWTGWFVTCAFFAVVLAAWFGIIS